MVEAVGIAERVLPGEPAGVVRAELQAGGAGAARLARQIDGVILVRDRLEVDAVGGVVDVGDELERVAGAVRAAVRHDERGVAHALRPRRERGACGERLLTFDGDEGERERKRFGGRVRPDERVVVTDGDLELPAPGLDVDSRAGVVLCAGDPPADAAFVRQDDEGRGVGGRFGGGEQRHAFARLRGLWHRRGRRFRLVGRVGDERRDEGNGEQAGDCDRQPARERIGPPHRSTPFRVAHRHPYNNRRGRALAMGKGDFSGERRG